MPRTLLQSRIPVDLSLVEFDLDSGDEIFLTVCWPRRDGPDIRRTGKGPPVMPLIGGRPGETTTHPFGLRVGTWLIGDDLRQGELQEAERELASARHAGVAPEDIDVLRATVTELPGVASHRGEFERRCPGWVVQAQQGCGDLTMNAWNVAFVNHALADEPPLLVCLPNEPVDDRTYSCLVKWNTGPGAASMTIEEVRFQRRALAPSGNSMLWVRFRDVWLPRGDRVEFAVSNQQVIRNGQVVPAWASCHQFGDVRHLIQMPNLNPVGRLYPGEPPGGQGGSFRPRTYFNQPQQGDIWFGEGAFLDDGLRNLLRAALTGPVLLAPPAGADVARVRGAMALSGYREAHSGLAPLAMGEWRFVRRSAEADLVEIFLRRATYGWTMLGLSRDGRRLFGLAIAGRPGGPGYTLEEAAAQLRDAGAWNALLIDEGADVFQKLRADDDRMVDTVPSIRRRVRATFIVARRETGAGQSVAPELQLTPGAAPAASADDESGALRRGG